MESYWINLFASEKGRTRQFKIGQLRIPATVGGEKGLMVGHRKARDGDISDPIRYEVNDHSALNLIPGVFLDMPIRVLVYSHTRGVRAHRFFWAETVSAEFRGVSPTDSRKVSGPAMPGEGEGGKRGRTSRKKKSITKGKKKSKSKPKKAGKKG